MIFKYLKKASLTLLITITIMPSFVLAYSDYIIASGKNIGIEVKYNGVIVVGFYDEQNKNELQIGDIITSINDNKINNIDEMIAQIENSQDKNNIKITYLREDTIKEGKIKLSDNKTGLYVKDSVAGIGTLTFIDPNTKLYGALGHEIIEKSTKQIVNIKDGTIFASKVTGIIPSENGIPGEKQAVFYSDQIEGNIKENTNKGIFGIYKSIINKENLYKVAGIKDIKKGKAQILTVLDNNNVEKFDINILKINTNDKTKNLIFEITDKNLLNKTGGIVQGMSGSPIIQGEYIIGAITHVIVNNPTKGYGIFITNMLEEAEN